MKKLFLLLVLISSFGFSQEDKANRILFKEYKKFSIESTEIKNLVNKSLDDIISKTKDSILITDINNYKKSLDTITLPEFKKIEFQSIPKDKFKNFKVNYDKFKKSGFVKHKKYKEKFYVYLNLNNEDSHMRIRSTYFGPSWLFVNKIIFIIDGKNYEIPFSNPDREVRSGSGVNVEEITDQAVLKHHLKVLELICNSKSEIDIRFEGDKGVSDRKLSLKEIETIKETVDLYNSL